MATILAFKPAALPQKSYRIRDIRRELGLSLSQAAAALEVSAATIEIWESNPETAPCSIEISDRFHAFIAKNGIQAGKNLIFGCYSLRLGREILGISIDQMAKDYGYSKSSWLRIESNCRSLPDEKLKNIELRVKNHLAGLCSTI